MRTKTTQIRNRNFYQGFEHGQQSTWYSKQNSTWSIQNLTIFQLTNNLLKSTLPKTRINNTSFYSKVDKRIIKITKRGRSVYLL